MGIKRPTQDEAQKILEALAAPLNVRADWPPFKTMPANLLGIAADLFSAPMLPSRVRVAAIVVTDLSYPDGTREKVEVASFRGSRSKEPDEKGYYTFTLELKVKEIPHE